MSRDFRWCESRDKMSKKVAGTLLPLSRLRVGSWHCMSMASLILLLRMPVSLAMIVFSICS